MVGKQKKPQSLPSSCSGKHTQKSIHHEGKMVLCTGPHWKQWKVPEGKESWPESARMSEASRAHLDRWFHSQLMRVLTLTLFSYLTFSLSENTLCAAFKFFYNPNRVQSFHLSKRKWRRLGSGDIFYYIHILTLIYTKWKDKPKAIYEAGNRI